MKFSRVALNEEKIEVLNILRKGPMCFSELTNKVHRPSDEIRSALSELSGLVDIRDTPFLENDEDAEMWGIVSAFGGRQKDSRSA